VSAKEEPLHSVEASTVDSLMSDEKAESSIEEDAIHSRREGKKDIINIDTLSENFNDGDTVDLDALLEKKLVPANTGYVKVLARGVLDKKLIVDLDDFSLQAVKMIVLMGGRAKKVQ
jgi:ribosomal protein L15